MARELFGADYDEKPEPRGAPGQYEPCACCGKPVRIDRTHWRVEYDEQGWYAIGSECRRDFPTAQRCPSLQA